MTDLRQRHNMAAELLRRHRGDIATLERINGEYRFVVEIPGCFRRKRIKTDTVAVG